MSQPQKNNDSLTAAQQARREVWSQALVTAGIAPETMDWTQQEISSPLNARGHQEGPGKEIKHSL